MESIKVGEIVAPLRAFEKAQVIINFLVGGRCVFQEAEARRKGMGEEAIKHCRSYALEAERKMGEMLAQTESAEAQILTDIDPEEAAAIKEYDELKRKMEGEAKVGTRTDLGHSVAEVKGWTQDKTASDLGISRQAMINTLLALDKKHHATGHDTPRGDGKRAAGDGAAGLGREKKESLGITKPMATPPPAILKGPKDAGSLRSARQFPPFPWGVAAMFFINQLWKFLKGGRHENPRGKI